MGIYGALTTAVTGMAAQSFALENISGNIANSQTTGYKRMETGFIDLIPDAAVGRQVPGAVLAYSRSTNDVRGDIITSPTGTHVALNGSGFFVVAEKTGTSDGQSVFGEANFYTRRGDFEMDREGYLRNGAGYYLKGVPINTTTGNVAGSVPEMIRISNGLIPAQVTQRIGYELNLPSIPDLAASPAAQISGVSGLEGTDGIEADLGWLGGSSFEITIGGTTNTFAASSTSTLDDLVNWINTDVTGASASIVAGQLQITPATSMTLGGDGSTIMGFAPGPHTAAVSSTAAGLVGTDGLVADIGWNFGESLTLTVEGGATHTFPVNGTTTIQDLVDWVNDTVPGASASINDDGEIEIVSDRIDTDLTFGGDANLLAELGLTAGVETAPDDPESRTDFVENTIDGGAVTIYSADGAAVSVEMRWAKISNEPDTWRLYYMNQSQPESWTRVPTGEFTFDKGLLQLHNNQAVSENERLRIDIPNLTVNGTTVGNVELDFGAGGLTQFDNANGRASDVEIQQDGYPAGSFMSVAVNDSGRVVATYSNGKQIEIFQLVTANFNAENQLKRLDGGVYASTAASGEAIYSTDGGVTGGALESSNTDISEEFTKLIVTQQAYAAGTRIVSTSDEMLQEALNMMR